MVSSGGTLKDGKRREAKVFLHLSALCDFSGSRKGFPSLASALSSSLRPFVVLAPIRKVPPKVLASVRVIYVFLATPRMMLILLDKNKKFYFLDHKYSVCLL